MPCTPGAVFVLQFTADLYFFSPLLRYCNTVAGIHASAVRCGSSCRRAGSRILPLIVLPSNVTGARSEGHRLTAPTFSEARVIC